MHFSEYTSSLMGPFLFLGTGRSGSLIRFRHLWEGQI